MPFGDLGVKWLPVKVVPHVDTVNVARAVLNSDTDIVPGRDGLLDGSMMVSDLFVLEASTSGTSAALRLHSDNAVSERPTEIW